MICTSLQRMGLDEIVRVLESGAVEMAEIRLDSCDLDGDEIEDLFLNSDVPLVATCRLDGMDPAVAEERLLKAIEAGARYADLEMEASSALGRKVRQHCQQYGTVLIRSWHEMTGTPPDVTLRANLEKGFRFGGEIVKIVTMATCPEDVARVMALYDEAVPGSLIAFCAGEIGRESRLEALRKGAPYTYASLSAGQETAPGQWETARMREAVYGNFRFLSPAAPVRLPASKSFAQRAILFAALSDGVSHLEGYTPCGDSEAALEVARALGAVVRREGTLLEIKGIGARAGSMNLKRLQVGESGLLARMMTPLAAVLSPSGVEIGGEGTLLRRPLSGAHDLMAPFGVRLYRQGAVPQRREDVMVPFTVTGPLVPGRADVPGRGGSQLISGLLAALPLAEGKSVAYVHDPRSIPYMFITVDVLKRFGIEIGSEMEGGDDFLETQDWSLCTGVTFRTRGPQRYRPADFVIEGDWSGAANLMVAGAIFGAVELEGLDTQSLQADISIMDILMDAGAGLSQLEGETETTGLVRVGRSPLVAFETNLNNCPDLFPIVAVLAAFCEGESHILGVGRLAHKESDRASAIVEMLSGMGVPAEIAGDELIVRGMSLTRRLLTGQLLRGGSFASHGDHRMVMALKVASLGCDAPVVIDDTACVAKSYPGFLETFETLISPL